ncbi:EamA family transporter [Pseudonocardia bannensis]|uniref:EamA family transporter n=1 Tax=Pseudonocardia bannensis TaxID=630973 RepID=A0A848DAB2_9PSEU|nr:EamA family transporter [Pseudonocardia bannensis]NMH90213.1 EamA family transporter [Pseudonocardia bannensis]
MIPVLLALGTAVGYGVANFLGPTLGRRMPLAAVLLGSQLAGLAVSTVLVLGSAIDMTVVGVAFALAAGVSNAAALAAFYRAGTTGDLSVVAPITATSAAVPVLLGLVTGDRPGVPQIVGIPVALIGIALAARPQRSSQSRPVPVPVGGAPPVDVPPARTAGSRGVGWAMLAALLFGVFLTTYAHAADDSPTGALFWSRVSLVTATAIGIVVLRAAVRVPGRDALLVLIPGLLLALGTYTFGEAARLGLLSVVSVIATLNPVITVLLAVVVLRERLARAQWIGTLTALAGVVLLAAG